jgi:tetratricopeptide (TPR) repeat protein
LAPPGLGLILLTTMLVYSPALHGGVLWDDDQHLIPPKLQSAAGLYRIWFDVGATQQYYPVLYSAFWVEHKLWGDSVFGYHVVNVLWHMLAVVLLYFILVRLKIPGALLAAAIFALHPVMVESVAWMSEQKNTLSAVFCLSAMLAFLKFDESRQKSNYFLSLGLFLLGLLTKTPITAPLPAALLVVFWWQRGELSWRRDVGPLIPFFVLGAMGGLVTAWVEREVVGAEGVDFELTLLQRGLLANQVIWFYVSKLLWPVNLAFIYRRWEIDPFQWWQWLCPIATLGAFVWLWLLRHRWRGPLAAWLIFVGALVPVLGFLNVYPFKWSFVADHYQYIASLGIFVLVAAGIATGLERASLPIRRVGLALCILLVGTLAALSWKQSHIYVDGATIYRATLERNPDCWVAHNNLGTILAAQGQQQEAIEHYRAAIRIRPNYYTAHSNLGTALIAIGQAPEAFDHLRKAIELEPNSVDARRDLGHALSNVGRPAEAIEVYHAALSLRPDDPITLNSLGAALASLGRFPEAIEHLQHAVRLNPDYAEARGHLGDALAKSGKTPEGIAELQRAVALEPHDQWTINSLAIALMQAGRFPEAIEQFRRAVELSPTAESHNNLGSMYMSVGHQSEAIVEFQAALRLKPDFARALSNLGNALTRANRFSEAITHLEQALELQPDLADAHMTLGVALMHSGKLPQAIDHHRTAIRLKPDFVEAYANLAQALKLAKQSDESIAAVEKGIQIAKSTGQLAAARQLQDWLSDFRAETNRKGEAGSAPQSTRPASNP